MAKRRFDHRGVRFSIRRNAAGYAWQHVPEGVAALNDPHVWGPVPLEFGPASSEKLAPVEWARLGEDLGILQVMDGRTTLAVSGLDVARRAFNGFRVLAETITRWETIHASWEDIKDDDRPWSADGDVVNVLTTDLDEMRRLIVDYANDFGTLWGDNDPRGLQDWIDEAAYFLAVLDVARALRPGGDTDVVESCLRLGHREGEWRPASAPPDQLEYASPRPFAERMVVARRGQRSEGRRARNALPEVTDYFDLAMNGSPRQRVRMVLHVAVNRRLVSGLDFNISPLDERHSVVVPHHLAHLLYLRLWMDTVDGSDLEGQRTCLNCGRALRGTKRKTYCDDQCRAEYHNRRRARP